MKTKQYNYIIRTEYPKWNGWKILDFYNSINLGIDSKEQKVIGILEENFYLIKELENIIQYKK
jgi:hypothetical protein